MTTGEDRRERILDVAERLFAERGSSDVTIRDIAEEARVTHPLIYYYWSSKEELLAATFARAQDRVRKVPQHIDRVETVVAIARESLEHNRRYLLTLTRALLDGLPPEQWPGGFPAIEAILSMATRDLPEDEQTDARARVASAVAMLYGWALIEEPLLTITGLSGVERERARETLFESIRDVIRPLSASDPSGSLRPWGRLRVSEVPGGRQE